MLTLHWWRTRFARWKGASDGGKEIPALKQEQPAYYEQILCDRGRQRVHRLWARHCRRLERLEGRADSLFQRFKTTTENFAQEHLRYLKRRSYLGRDVLIYVKRFWYLLFLLVIMCGEWILKFSGI